MQTIQEALRELNNLKLNEAETKKIHGNTQYPQLSSFRELMELYDFLWYDKHLDPYLFDSHFSIVRSFNTGDDNKKEALRSINVERDDREYALLKYTGKPITHDDYDDDWTPGKNAYANIDLKNINGKVGTLKLNGWGVHGSSRSLKEFDTYLREFYEKQGYDPELIDQYMDLTFNAANVVNSKDYGSALQISFGLRSPAPRFLKRSVGFKKDI